MSLENLKIVRALYPAMNNRDSERVTELLHPEVEWVPDARVGEGPIQGREKVIQFFIDRAAMFEAYHVEVERLWETDDQVLAFVRVTGSGRGSGAQFDIRIGHLWTVHDELGVRGEGFGDRGKALEAAGLSE